MAFIFIEKNICKKKCEHIKYKKFQYFFKHKRFLQKYLKKEKRKKKKKMAVTL